jgi:hypothetical protein
MGSKVSKNTKEPVRWEEMSIYRNIRVMGSSVNKQGQFMTEPAMQRSAQTLPRGWLQSQSQYTFKC